MQEKNKTMITEFPCGKTCEQCGACRNGQKQALLREVKRIGDAAIGKKLQLLQPDQVEV